MESIGAIIVFIGSVFLFLGALGLVRMPDLFNRIQAGTKASTLGTMLSLAGLFFLIPGWSGKLIVLIIYVMITNPVSSHVLGRAAHYIGLPMYPETLTDQLKENRSETDKKEDL